MRIVAAISAGPDEPLRLEQVELAEPGAGEVLVRLVATGVCHTDRIAHMGRSAFPLPGVLGHEGVGRVVAVGPGVTGLAPDDAVLLGWPWCGGCRPCLAGMPRYCSRQPELIFGGGSSLRRLDGRPLAGGFFGQSSFATHTVVRARSLVPVQTSVPLAAVGTLACGFATGAGAVLYVARPEPGSTVVVIGVGAVGLAAVMAARCTAAGEILAVDRDPARLELAAKCGATKTLEISGVRNAARAIRMLCGGPAEAVIECTGDPKAIRHAVDATAMPGVCVLVGMSSPGETFTVDQQTTLRGKRIQGCLGGQERAEVIVPALLRLAEQGRFGFHELVEYFPFEAAQEALRSAAVKPVLVFGSH